MTSIDVRRKRLAALKAATAFLDDESEKRVDVRSSSGLKDISSDLKKELAYQEALIAEHVIEVHPNSTPEEFYAARIAQAVRRGERTYLPYWPSKVFGLPSILLRSAMFDASAKRVVIDGEIAAQGDVTITIEGTSMGGLDERVYGHCLDAYQDGPRPLAVNESSEWICTNFRQFVELLGKRYTEVSHVDLRESLQRLSSANVNLRWTREITVEGRKRRMDLQTVLPRLVEVVMVEEKDSKGRLLCNGFSAIRFRISEQTANLFGRGGWTMIDKDFYKGRKGLSVWLGAFYRSHSRPKWVTVDSLQALSNSQANRISTKAPTALELREAPEGKGVPKKTINSEADFRVRLKEALESLKGEDVPEAERITWFDVKKRPYKTRDSRGQPVTRQRWEVLVLKKGWFAKDAENETAE